MEHRCPGCGKPGRRQRRLRRRIRSLGYRQVDFLDVHHAADQACCSFCKSIRSWPVDVPAKADYDHFVRQAALKRDFFLKLSQGLIYGCLRWQIARLDLTPHRQLVLEQFSAPCASMRFTWLLGNEESKDVPELEKSCALRSDLLARMHFAPLPPLDHAELGRLLPLLPVPRPRS